MLEIRPHHILCIFGWRGRGYDEQFTGNFNKIVDSLWQVKESELKLVAGADDVCRACPNYNFDQCRLETDTQLSADAIDRRVLKRVDLKTGEIYRVKDLLSRVALDIRPAELISICDGCMWLELGWCAEGLTRGTLFSAET